MSSMTQEQMQRLVRDGSTILDDRGLSVLNFHMSEIAIAALGENKEALNKALSEYAEWFEHARDEIDLPKEKVEEVAKYTAWLRSL